MHRPLVMVAWIALAMPAAPIAAQRSATIEAEVKALNSEWKRAWAARDLDAYIGVFDRTSPGLFILGGEALTLDSLRARVSRVVSQRTNETWTEDLVVVTPLNDSTVFLQTSSRGRYTLQNGQTWEHVGGAVTALVKKRGSGWKVVAFQNAISGGRRMTP